jgi:hypothetical protein
LSMQLIESSDDIHKNIVQSTFDFKVNSRNQKT